MIILPMLPTWLGCRYAPPCQTSSLRWNLTNFCPGWVLLFFISASHVGRWNYRHVALHPTNSQFQEFNMENSLSGTSFTTFIIIFLYHNPHLIFHLQLMGFKAHHKSYIHQVFITILGGWSLSSGSFFENILNDLNYIVAFIYLSAHLVNCNIWRIFDFPKDFEGILSRSSYLVKPKTRHTCVAQYGYSLKIHVKFQGNSSHTISLQT
jgi:hypothetical protein